MSYAKGAQPHAVGRLQVRAQGPTLGRVPAGFNALLSLS